MPSEAHQWLVLWAARKMSLDGFVISGYDGPTPQGGLWNMLASPSVLEEVRPDVSGVHRITREVAYGEAKTAPDLPSSHTNGQFRILANAVRNGGVRLYIAVPRSACMDLDRTLNRAGLLGHPRVVRLHVPDILLVESLRDVA